jgi:hypothetical protein
MNERIKKLIEMEMHEYYDGAYADGGSAKAQLAYFAELIIRDVANFVSNQTDVPNGLDMEIVINKYFGVK